MLRPSMKIPWFEFGRVRVRVLARRPVVLTRGFSSFSFFDLPGKRWDGALKETTSDSFQILFSASFTVIISFDAVWIANCRKGTSPKNSQYEFSPSWYSSEVFWLVPFMQLAIHISFVGETASLHKLRIRRVRRKHVTRLDLKRKTSSFLTSDTTSCLCFRHFTGVMLPRYFHFYL
jgi:hypothetical protein